MVLLQRSVLYVQTSAYEVRAVEVKAHMDPCFTLKPWMLCWVRERTCSSRQV